MTTFCGRVSPVTSVRMGYRKVQKQEKVLICELRRNGATVKEIARHTRRAVGTVWRILRRNLKVPVNQIEGPKSSPGRPPKLTPRSKRLLRRVLMYNPFLKAQEFKEKYPQWFGHVSIRTLQRVARVELKLPIRKAAAKPLLTLHMVKARLRWCRQYKDYTPAQWSRVMWSDESLFKVISARRSWVRRPANISRFHARWCNRTVKHPAKVMIWGAFTGAGGRAGLAVLPVGKTMNGKMYKNMLSRHLPTFMELHGADIFMQDGAPCHRAREVMDWLERHHIPIMNWPGNSPDLNPIENCWKIMKDKVAKYGQNVSVKTLINSIKTVWTQELTPDYFKKLSDSMPERIKAVLKARGQMTKY